jgi:lysine/ornithine N-monooxygenase
MGNLEVRPKPLSKSNPNTGKEKGVTVSTWSHVYKIIYRSKSRYYASPSVMHTDVDCQRYRNGGASELECLHTITTGNTGTREHRNTKTHTLEEAEASTRMQAGP